MLTDPISDMLTRIRNALMANKSEVIFPHSKIKLAIAKILEKEGFIGKTEAERKDIKIILKYKDKMPAVNFIKRVSKPGCRVYLGVKDIRMTAGKIRILSTPLGVMTDKEARKRRVGGEVICEVC